MREPVVPEHLTCRRLVELVTDYLDGALPLLDRVRFEQHLGDCEACEAYVEQFRTTVKLAGRLREEDVPAPARDVLLEAIRGWRDHPGDHA